MLKLVSALLFLAGGFAYAQSEVILDSQAIVVNPRPNFGVEVWVDRDPTGTRTPVYEVGEEIEIGVRVTDDSYIYLFSVHNDGTVNQILPNRFDRDGANNFLRAGETKYFPPRGARYTFNVDPPRGLDKVIAVASREQLDTEALAQFTAGSDFATSNIGEDGFARAFSIVVRPVPQNDWVTDTVSFYVGTPPPQPRTGTLAVVTRPRGADAYLNGTYIGRTPINRTVATGTHQLELRLDGYETYRTTVNINAGRSSVIDVALREVPRVGVIAFTSNPRGAEVIIGGRSYGTTPTRALSFQTGQYEAIFRRAGYEDTRVSFTVSTGRNQTVHAELRELPRTGDLIIQANVGGALVFIDGRPAGIIPSGSGLLPIRDLQPGVHELTVIAPGFYTYSERFTITAGRETRVTVRQLRR